MTDFSGYTYENLFLVYLRNPGTATANDIAGYLLSQKKAKGSRDYLELPIPEGIQNEIMKQIMIKSVMYGELRTRTVEDPIAKDPLYKPNIHTHIDSIHPKLSEISNKDISINIGREAYDSHIDTENVIIETITNMVSSILDTEIVSLNTGPNYGINSILLSHEVFGHPSESLRTIGGYIDNENLTDFSLNSLRQVLYHLPSGYRQRAKWYMNSETADKIAEMARLEEIKTPLSSMSKNPNSISISSLLGKPIVINEFMPDTGLAVMLADLSRGYFVPFRLKDMRLTFNNKYKAVFFSYNFGGRVLQPAAFKALRIGVNIPIINTSNKEDIDHIEFTNDIDDNGDIVYF